MNKAELIKHLAAQADTTASTVNKVVDALIATVASELAAGNDVMLPGLGKFSFTDRAARTGRNPATGEELQIAAKRAPKFTAATALKNALS